MTRIYCLETYQVLQSIGVTILIPSSGTMGANGALSAITALTNTYPNIYLYFPAGKVYSGSAAGFYYAEMSSTTAGTVYNNIYTPGTNEPDIPASPTPITDAGPGAYTQSTSEITAVSATVPGGSMGRKGVIKSEASFFVPNNANGKNFKFYFGGTVSYDTNIPNAVTGTYRIA